ncbi:hypothetical protein [Cupriavidus sp. TMH.W2]|uniref:hypothetical protein n=1 Tax=Cupriavidus sp. TMH.W2 TaxID=3434465 RepID=UPI003D76F301
MRPSLAAHSALPALPPGTGRMISFEEMRLIAIGANLDSPDGAAVVVPGEQVTHILTLDRLEDIETHINSLAMDVKFGSKPVVEDSLRATLHIAETATNAHELHYLQAMFIHHRQVLLALAANRHIPEPVQLALATDNQLLGDRRLQRVLASNPALTASVMQTMWEKTEDSQVQLRIAQNAASRANEHQRDNDYAKLAEGIYKASYDGAVRTAAIAGIRDPELLRRIASTNDVTFGAAELTALAGNRHAPVDVLRGLATPEGRLQEVQRLFSPLSSQRIAKLARENMHRKLVSDATHYHSSPD